MLLVCCVVFVALFVGCCFMTAVVVRRALFVVCGLGVGLCVVEWACLLYVAVRMCCSLCVVCWLLVDVCCLRSFVA